jgi:hypothetical protein
MLEVIENLQKEIGQRLQAAARRCETLGAPEGFEGEAFRASSALGYWEASAEALRDLYAFVREAEDLEASKG